MSVLHCAPSLIGPVVMTQRIFAAVTRVVLVQHVKGRVVTPDGVVEDGLVVVDGGRVRYVGPAAGAAYDGPRSPPAPPEVTSGATVLPGLVDVHNHGGGGGSFSGGDSVSVHRAAGHHRSHGTTSVVASVATDEPAVMARAVGEAAEATLAGEVAGIHVEGPFLAHSRCGAQDPRWLRPPDLAAAGDLLDAGAGQVRVMTVAPELAGVDALVRLLWDAGVVPAVGHTEAGARQVRRLLGETRQRLGRPGLVTHLFNGMPAFHHRADGPVAGALGAAAAGDAFVEVIADGVHVADQTVRMVFDLLGPDRVVLVTDAMAAAGMGDGRYTLGPQPVVVENGTARLATQEGAGTLAGGTSHLLDVVRRSVGAGVPLEDAVLAASRTPAAALGLDHAGLTEGGPADLVVTDAELHVLRVMRGGAWVSRRCAATASADDVRRAQEEI